MIQQNSNRQVVRCGGLSNDRYYYDNSNNRNYGGVFVIATKILSLEPLRAYQTDADGNLYTNEPQIVCKGEDAKENFINELKDGFSINCIDLQLSGEHTIIEICTNLQKYFIVKFSFLDALVDLQKHLPDGVVLKCCMTCRHGNMCPFGNQPGELFVQKVLYLQRKVNCVIGLITKKTMKRSAGLPVAMLMFAKIINPRVLNSILIMITCTSLKNSIFYEFGQSNHELQFRYFRLSSKFLRSQISRAILIEKALLTKCFLL